jgi:hypothetical protein
MTMHKQLPMVSHLCAGHPDTRKATFDQQLQYVARVSPVRLLLPYIAGTDLSCVADPYFMAKPLQQLNKPLIVADRFDAHKSRRSQSTVKPLCFTRGVHQLMLCGRATLSIEHGNLLKAWMEITTYDDHPGSFPPADLVPKPTTV